MSYSPKMGVIIYVLWLVDVTKERTERMPQQEQETAQTCCKKSREEAILLTYSVVV